MRSSHKVYYNDNPEMDIYYEKAKEASHEFKKSKWFWVISNFVKDKNTICELGCWEWTKLSTFRKKWRKLYGFDISKTAIEKWKKQYKDINFLLQDAEDIKWYNEFFDCTMSFFCLEHIEQPESYIKNMINLTKKWWIIVFLFPNYWSPLFPAPPTLYNKNIINKFFLIWKRLIFPQKNYYRIINPIIWNYECDYDAASEVYMKYFRRYLQNQWLKIVFESSCWDDLYAAIKFKLYLPFKYFCKFMWPYCFMVLQK